MVEPYVTHVCRWCGIQWSGRLRSDSTCTACGRQSFESGPAPSNERTRFVSVPCTHCGGSIISIPGTEGVCPCRTNRAIKIERLLDRA